MLLYPLCPRRPVLWSFWLCRLLRVFQPFGIPQPCPEATQQQVRCSDFNVPLLWTWSRPTLPTPCMAAGSASCWLWAAFSPHK